MKHNQRLEKIEQRLNGGRDVIGVYWPDEPDEIKVGGEVMTRQQWDDKYPDATHIIVRGDI